MRTIVTSTDVYEYEELTQGAQEKVLQEFYAHGIIDPDWYECVGDHWKEKLETVGFADAEIHFSGFYSQGDGACFDAEVEVNERVFDCFVGSISNNSQTERLFTALLHHSSWFYDFLSEYCSFSMQTIGHSYSHENTRRIAGSTETYVPCNGLLEWCFNEFRNYLEELRRDLSQDIYVALRDECEYLTSAEAMVETIKINEYVFTMEGKLYA